MQHCLSWCGLRLLQKFIGPEEAHKIAYLPLSMPRRDIVDGLTVVRFGISLDTITACATLLGIDAIIFVLEFYGLPVMTTLTRFRNEVGSKIVLIIGNGLVRLLTWKPSRRRLVQILSALVGFAYALWYCDWNEMWLRNESTKALQLWQGPQQDSALQSSGRDMPGPEAFSGAILLCVSYLLPLMGAAIVFALAVLVGCAYIHFKRNWVRRVGFGVQR